MNSFSLLTEITPEADQSLEFLSLWFSEVEPDSLISIMKIHPTMSKTKPLVFPLNQVLEAISSSGLDTLIWDSGMIYDLYFSVSTLKQAPPKGRRGTLKDVHKVPGVWIDLDVKSNSFSSSEDVLEFLSEAVVPPSAIVQTDSGGLHAYWKLDTPVDCDTGSDLSLRWWAYLSDLAYPRSIDRLCDPSRVLRLPGSIRWPKKPDQSVSKYSLISTSDSVYTQEDIIRITSEAWSEHQARIQRTRRKVETAKSEANVLLSEYDNGDNKWLHWLNLADIEDNFNDYYSWESVLVPQGWTLLSQDDEGRVLWSRPGDGIRKSATTDWTGSPHIMSLFSTSPDTGLSDLHDSGVILTKYRVWVELYWAGDEKAAIQSLLDNKVFD